MARRAAFIDRDDTINSAPIATYLRSAAEFTWQPGSIAGLVRLARAGYVLVVVSNQQGVALGEVDSGVLVDVEEIIEASLAEAGSAIRAYMYCLHREGAGCACRKPRPGMLHQAAIGHDLDLPASWMVGDRRTDVAAGAAAGCRTVLLGDHEPPITEATLRCKSLLDAADQILALR